MRKYLMIAAAAAALGTASLASTEASAYWPGSGWGGPHWGWGGPHWGGWGGHPYWGGYYGSYGYPAYSAYGCHWTPYPYPHKVCFY